MNDVHIRFPHTRLSPSLGRIDCARCAAAVRAEYLVEFGFNDTTFQLDLCRKHTDLFDLDLMPWIQCSTVRVNA